MSFRAMPQHTQQAAHRKTTSDQDLEQALLAIPDDETYILGDLNACGSRNSTKDPWDRVMRGPHGYGISNDAGKELLNFFPSIELLCATPGLGRRT